MIPTEVTVDRIENVIGYTLTFKSGKVFDFKKEDSASATYIRYLPQLKGQYLYLEVEPKEQFVVRILIPKFYKIRSIGTEPVKGTERHLIVLEDTHGKHYLNIHRSRYKELLAIATEAHLKKEQVLVTEESVRPEIIDIRIIKG